MQNDGGIAGARQGTAHGIFAPTFSPASALNYAGEEIVETLLVRCNVIAKLHDRSLDGPALYGGIDWRERLARFSGRISARHRRRLDAMRARERRDGHRSTARSAFEFCVADRPLVVFDAPGLIEAARINPDKVGPAAFRGRRGLHHGRACRSHP